MDDYISRSSAKRLIADIQLGESPRDAPCTVYQSGIHEGLNIAFGAIVTMRSAEVRPVVYCKDCKWYRESELLAPNRFCFRLKGKDGKPVGYNFSDMDFCSYGERREGGTP